MGTTQHESSGATGSSAGVSEYFVRDIIQNLVIQSVKVDTSNKIAYIFTRAKQYPQFNS